jgi:transposase
MAEHPRKDRTASGSRQRTRRQQALRAQGATHPRPEAVTDPLFRDSAFFDPNDLVQVKYEMLRSVQQEERSVVEAAQASGLSRPAFYVTQEVFQREGLPGLLPRKRGPKRPHKLSDEAMAVLAQQIQEAGRMLKGEELAALLARRFGVEAHPRSILRRLLPYLRREEKKLR